MVSPPTIPSAWLAKVASLAVILLLFGLLQADLAGQDRTSALKGSKHDLSVAGPGPITSGEESACVFCHADHLPNASDPELLWNQKKGQATYDDYGSSTYDAPAPAISLGKSKLCLSCHDGTIALGNSLSKGLIPTLGSMNPDTNLSTDLANDHPVAIQPVDDGQLAPSLFQSPAKTNDPSVTLAAGRIECTSCHTAHDPAVDPMVPKFLKRSNDGGKLCLACHDPTRPQPNQLAGWNASAHATATNTTPTTNRFGPYGSVSANACMNCHQPHNATNRAAPRLTRNVEEATCTPCHSGSNLVPALGDVMRDFSKLYAHPTVALEQLHDPREDAFPLNGNRHAECFDCHQPHQALSGGLPATPPAVEPALNGVSGFNGVGPLLPATNEYEVCFKCHADSSNKPQGTPGYSAYGRTPDRLTDSAVSDPYNVRLEFDSLVSRHNVSLPRQRSWAEVPSLRANILHLDGSPGRSLGPGTYIYCTDCHSSDESRKSKGPGPNGPHGSAFTHLTERRYDLEVPPLAAGSDAPGVSYSSGINGTAGLCNKCHDVDNNLLQDRSFRKHDKHVRGEDASCATCHEPHGIHGGTNSNNPSLINFDVAIVGPSGSGLLRFERTGLFSGRCYLTCHGRDHDPESY